MILGMTYVPSRGFAVFHLIDTELLRRIRLDVGEPVVVIDRLNVERSFVCLVGIVELEPRRIGAFVLIHRLLDVRLQSGKLLPRLFELDGGHELRRAARGHNRRTVGGLDDHLQIRSRR